jgi:riboflavin kinase / FMN adenylyltransferase
MRVLTGPPGSRFYTGPAAVAIGDFDGVHAGHRAVIAELRRQAAGVHCPAVVVVFDSSADRRLTCPDERLHLLGRLGADIACLPDMPDGDGGLRAQRQLYHDVLGRGLATRIAVHGAARGRGLAGADADAGDEDTAKLVAEVSSACGFPVHSVPLVLMPGDLNAPVSAEEIRLAVARNDLALARCLLGRFHGVRGHVVRGDGRGRLIGYPTANIALAEGAVLPADGVFAGTYQRPDGSLRPAVLSLGTRPTFYSGGERILEAHVLDCDASMYGEPATVRFIGWIRDQRRFGSVGALAVQIGHDAIAVRAALASSRGPGP